jgi:hypothetical protein
MAPRPYPLDMFWDKALHDVEGNYLGQIEAVAWGRDGVARRVGVRGRPDTDGLRFFVVDEAIIDPDKIRLRQATRVEALCADLDSHDG